MAALVNEAKELPIGKASDLRIYESKLVVFWGVRRDSSIRALYFAIELLHWFLSCTLSFLKNCLKY